MIMNIVKIYFMINIIICIISLCLIYKNGNDKLYGITNFNMSLLIGMIIILLVGLPYNVLRFISYCCGSKSAKEFYEFVEKYYDF